MKNQNENAGVSDVTARMREEASIVSLLNGQSVGVASVVKKLREFADSIDAAVSKMETTTPGNNAAMRNALLNALTRFKCLAMTSPEWRTCAESHVREIEAALAEPPRNFDRFNSVKDAAIAFARERQDAPQPCPDFTFSAWLLATATERKGDDDGRH